MASVTVTADSPAILPVESGSETGDTDQIVDASRLPQADFQPEAETTPETALSESTKATPAENAELQPSAQASTLFQRQTPTRSVPSPALRYSRGNLVDKPAPPATGDASKLPGAFFFITMNYDNGDKYRVVAYDPWVQSGNSRQDIQNFYKSGFPGTLPYYEYFDKKAPGPWVVGDGKFYCKYISNTFTRSPKLLAIACKQFSLGHPSLITLTSRYVLQKLCKQRRGEPCMVLHWQLCKCYCKRSEHCLLESDCEYMWALYKFDQSKF